MRFLRVLGWRLRGLFARQQLDREISAELESHLELHIAGNLRSGMTPEEARRAALVKLGGRCKEFSPQLFWSRMTKQQLVDVIAEQTGKPKADVESLMEALTGNIGAALASGGKVELRGFGTFSVRERKARSGRNPRTGETIQIAAKREAAFKAGKELNERVDQPQGTAVGVGGPGDGQS